MDAADRQPASERSFGRDGISGLVDAHRALRARDVSRPSPDELADAEEAVRTALARIDRGTPHHRPPGVC